MLFGQKPSAVLLERRRLLRKAFDEARTWENPSRLRITLAPPSTAFVGRQPDLLRLHDILSTGQHAALTQSKTRASLSGLGGIGKTTLAAEYVHRYGNCYAGVCWLAAQTEAGLLFGLAELAERAGIVVAGTDVSTAAGLALERNALLENWLIVYDNAPEPNAIRGFIPQSRVCVLITSRFSDWSSFAMEVPLEVLPIDEAVELLQRRANRKDELGAALLAETLGCFPLALDHAAATCRRAQIDFLDYANRYEQMLHTLPNASEYPQSVAVTFALAIEEAGKNCIATEALMAFVGLCAPDPIPMMLLEGAQSDERARTTATMALTELSLLTPVLSNEGSPTFVAHRLVQAVARARSRERGTSTEAFAKLVERLSEIYPSDGYQSPLCWPRCAELSPHILAMGDRPEAEASSNPAWPDVVNRTASYFQGRALLAEAEPLRRQALSLREKILGPDDPRTGMSINDVALVHYERDEHEIAIPLFERALRILEQKLPADHPDIATVLNNMALSLQFAGRMSDAESKYKRALEIRSSRFGRENSYTAQSLNNLGYFYSQVGRYPDALPLLEEALDVRLPIVGGEANSAQTLNNLAVLALRRGEPEAALPLSRSALPLYETSLGTDHPNTNRGRFNLSRILLALGRVEEALPFAETALTAHGSRLGEKHLWTLETATVLITIYRELGKGSMADSIVETYNIKADPDHHIL